LVKVCNLYTLLTKPSLIFHTAIGNQQLNCSAVEFVTLNPPSGSTCASYMQDYISMAGGYLANPEATTGCQFCSSRTTDEFLGRSFNIYYKNHWWQFGVFCSYIIFNVSTSFFLMDVSAEPTVAWSDCSHIRIDVALPHSYGQLAGSY
jgi:ABC-type multidrug transport system permease subunit